MQKQSVPSGRHCHSHGHATLDEKFLRDCYKLCMLPNSLCAEGCENLNQVAISLKEPFKRLPQLRLQSEAVVKT